MPLIISYRKGLKLDGSNPTILYGYGGFDVSLTPSFSVSVANWLDLGASMRWPTCAGAASTARPGTWRAPG